MLLALHPDDPPVPLLGLPRVVSTARDLAAVLAASDSPANGLCFCAGSLASRADNDIVAMAKQFARRIHFVHLRNVSRQPRSEGDHAASSAQSFVESDHLEGDVDVYAVVEQLVLEQLRRKADAASSEAYRRLPMRPDHGHQMLDDLAKTGCNPGYTAVGRLRGSSPRRRARFSVYNFIYEQRTPLSPPLSRRSARPRFLGLSSSFFLSPSHPPLSDSTDHTSPRHSLLTSPRGLCLNRGELWTSGLAELRGLQHAILRSRAAANSN